MVDAVRISKLKISWSDSNIFHSSRFCVRRVAALLQLFTCVQDKEKEFQSHEQITCSAVEDTELGTSWSLSNVPQCELLCRIRYSLTVAC